MSQNRNNIIEKQFMIRQRLFVSIRDMSKYINTRFLGTKNKMLYERIYQYRILLPAFCLVPRNDTEWTFIQKIVRLCLINPLLCHFEPDACPESRYIEIGECRDRGITGREILFYNFFFYYFAQREWVEFESINE